jgi:hypothetical protein
VIGDTGSGCNSKDLYHQFNTTAFAGPLQGSDGFESGNNYLRGCFQQVLDLAIARNIRFHGGKNIQLRAEMFNAPNQAIITGRNTTLQLSGMSDPLTNAVPTFDPITGLLNNGINLLSTGALSTNRSLPKNAGSCPPSLCGPLSLEKKITVFSSSPSSFNRVTIFPTLSSNRVIIAALFFSGCGQGSFEYGSSLGTSIPFSFSSLLA